MCDECDWEDHLEELDEMMDDPRFEWAYDTLEDIMGWVQDHEHITEEQIETYQSIQADR